MVDERADRVFLIDVDNTLLDNDRVIDDLRAHLIAQFGQTRADRYWVLFEALRDELGYADYLGALQRYRFDSEREGVFDPQLLSMSGFLVDYPFAQRLFPRALEVVARLDTLGTTVILSDGDVVFQPRKVQRSGLWDAVAGRVMICIHKEQMLAAVDKSFPAAHYVMVDDKLRILSAMKHTWGARLTTVFARQGHYAMDKAANAPFPPADRVVEQLQDLLVCDDAFFQAV